MSQCSKEYSEHPGGDDPEAKAQCRLLGCRRMRRYKLNETQVHCAGRTAMPGSPDDDISHISSLRHTIISNVGNSRRSLHIEAL